MHKFKCPLCGEAYIRKAAVHTHMIKHHSDEIPKDKSVSEYYFNLTTGKMHGSCVMCKKETTWNEENQKYNRFCSNKKCKEKYIELFRKRMIGKYGKTTLLDDPRQQQKMLMNRKISGEYEFTNHKGNKIPYTGTYELDFLKLCDVVLYMDPADIQAPCPYTFYYEYDKKKHFYIPDFYIFSLNLIVEIKDGGDNPNMHHKIQDVDKVKEELKDDVLKNQTKFNYIKITNKDYGPFIKLIMDMRSMDDSGKKQFVVV